MNESGICKFGNIQERDMDLMFMECLLTDVGFFRMFLSKAKIESSTVEVLNVALSETDKEYGESDITVLISVDGKKHALLIEDKINAQRCQSSATVIASAQTRRWTRVNTRTSICSSFSKTLIIRQMKKRRNMLISLHTKIAY